MAGGGCRWLGQRALVLLLILGVVKAGILLQLRTHLWQTHSRVWVYKPVVDAFREANFYVFGLLLLLFFYLLAREARTASPRIIRAVTAAFVTVGTLFFFLTRNQGDFLYLHSVMEGFLGWGDLRHYVLMDTVFAAPWLAAWVVGYLLAHGVLVGCRKESWSLLLLGTAMVGFLYWQCQPLMIWGKELFVLNVLLAWILLSQRLAPTPAKVWLLVPAKTARTGGPSGKTRVPEPWICRKNLSSARSQARAAGAGRASIAARSG